MSEREVYVYSIGFGGLLILNIFAVSIFLCCRRYNSKQHQKKKETGQFGNLDNDKDKTMIGSSYESTMNASSLTTSSKGHILKQEKKIIEVPHQVPTCHL